MFDLYPRHSHRTPQQIAEDTGGTFEPTRQHRHADGDGAGSSRSPARNTDTATEPNRKPDVAQPR